MGLLYQKRRGFLNILASVDVAIENFRTLFAPSEIASQFPPPLRWKNIQSTLEQGFS
jgi:hypothetical protein